MPLTINDLYLAAAMDEISWNYALLVAGLLYVDATGIAMSPPPTDQSEYHFYQLRLDALREYPNENLDYQKVMKALHHYITDIKP